MQLDKYIKTDLEQAEKLQICALNNILTCIEKGKEPPVSDISNISMSIIDKVLDERYNSYNADACKLDYVIFIPNSKYGISIDLLFGKKYIYEH